jgi:hypothetical protein
MLLPTTSRGGKTATLLVGGTFITYKSESPLIQSRTGIDQLPKSQILQRQDVGGGIYLEFQLNLLDGIDQVAEHFTMELHPEIELLFQPGGVLRLDVPDIQIIVQNKVNPVKGKSCVGVGARFDQVRKGRGV